MLEIPTCTWQTDTFDSLDVSKLYNILFLRAEVFVVEQYCPYLDVDNKDQKAIHLQGYYNGQLAAYCRLFRKGDYFESASIGRVVVAERFRRYGFGHQLMNKAIELQKTLFGEEQLTISGQLYLKEFYESHGFVQTSETYLEDNIPHIQMKINNIP